MQIDQKKLCPICTSTKTKILYSCTDHLTTQECFDLNQCIACGFVYTANAPGEKDIDKYYKSQNYISHSNTKQGLINSIYHLVRAYMLNKKGKLIDRLTANRKGSLLDVGAGIGLFAHQMQKRGWDIEAIEKNKGARDFAKKELGIELQDESIWKHLKPESKDVITLWHVLEHIDNLDFMWERLNYVLKREGFLIVALPNLSSYDSNFYKENWAALDVPRHLWHFNADTFKLMAKNKGFEIIKTKKMNFDGFYISILSEQSQKNSFAVLRGVYRGCIGWIKAFFNKYESSSIIYILKKKDIETLDKQTRVKERIS